MLVGAQGIVSEQLEARVQAEARDLQRKAPGSMAERGQVTKLLKVSAASTDRSSEEHGTVRLRLDAIKIQWLLGRVSLCPAPEPEDDLCCRQETYNGGLDSPTSSCGLFGSSNVVR